MSIFKPSDRKNLPLKLRWLVWLILWSGSVALVGYLVLAAGIYLGGWQAPTIVTVTKWLPTPVGLVVNRPLWASQYFNLEQALAHYNEYLAATTPQTYTATSRTENRRQALTKMIRDIGTTAVLNKYSLAVSSSDVDQAFTAQLTQSGDRQQVSKAINTYYGWTADEFKQQVIRPAVAREKLREKLSFDDNLNSLPRRQAEQVYALVKKGDQSFTALAKTYSEDSYALQGGDLGWFRRGEQQSEIDDVAFNLAPGQTSELIHTKYGWHILQVVDKRDVDGQAEVNARQIFIAAPEVDKFITQWLSGRVMVFIRGFIWNNATGQAKVK